MADKKYQVFISSTYADLKEERRKILDILLMADCIPSGMEAFVATDNEQFEVIKKVIDLCDYYVLIIGKRYGSVSSQTGISYTEMEYDYAKSKDIPVLVFAIDEAVELPEFKIETDQAKKDLLNQFREKTMSNRLVSIWKSIDELTGSLAISIMRAQKEVVRPGWQRAVDYDEVSLRREVMKIQQEKDKLETENSELRITLHDLTETDHVAFEGYEVVIEYHYSITSGRTSQRFDKKKTVDFPYLFEIISLEMLDVMIPETTVERIIKSKLLPSEYSCYFNDPQLVKKILNQLKELKLIKSRFNDSKSELFWGVTPKGAKVRSDKTLFTKK